MPVPLPWFDYCPFCVQVRAKQYYSDDVDRTANMPILLHGDGAFAGAPLLSSLWLR